VLGQRREVLVVEGGWRWWENGWEGTEKCGPAMCVVVSEGERVDLLFYEK